MAEHPNTFHFSFKRVLLTYLIKCISSIEYRYYFPCTGLPTHASVKQSNLLNSLNILDKRTKLNFWNYSRDTSCNNIERTANNTARADSCAACSFPIIKCRQADRQTAVQAL